MANEDVDIENLVRHMLTDENNWKEISKELEDMIREKEKEEKVIYGMRVF